MSDRKAPGGQMAVSSKQCDTKKQKAINTFKHNERVRKGTSEVGKARTVSQKAHVPGPLAQVGKSIENVMVAPIRCASKQQEARERLRSVARGVQGGFANVTNGIGGAVQGVGNAVTGALSSITRSGPARA